MSRHARIQSSTRIYHIVVKGADRLRLFEEYADYQKYLDILAYYKQECRLEIFAYCLMTNHVHLLIRHPEDITLQSIFRRINITYAGWFNLKYQRTGFQKLPLIERDHLLCELHKKRVSVRQLNRLTGTPRGVINRILAKNKTL